MIQPLLLPLNRMLWAVLDDWCMYTVSCVTYTMCLAYAENEVVSSCTVYAVLYTENKSHLKAILW